MLPLIVSSSKNSNLYQLTFTARYFHLMLQYCHAAKFLQHVSRFTAVCDQLPAIIRSPSAASSSGKYFLPLPITTKFKLSKPGWGQLHQSLLDFSQDSFTFLRNFCLCLSTTRQNRLQTFVDQSFLCASDTTQWRHSCVHTANQKLRYTKVTSYLFCDQFGLRLI